MRQPIFSIVIPSRGTRPKSLKLAIKSVLGAVEACSDMMSQDVELLVGFDGITGDRVVALENVFYFDLPADKNWGNAPRNILLKRARGEKVVFLDDDNALVSSAFDTYCKFFDFEMLIARIDVSQAFECSYLPQDQPGKSLVRQGNIDPLCLCLSRELVVVRCGGWTSKGGYEADYLNMLQYYRRARTIKVVQDVVGIYDAGQGLDEHGLNFRQEKLLKAGIKSRPI
ncbi:glycosyltransferase family 2 protein [Desulfonatronovibrio hydrogenovorans]|uniref:glycosyltransferase family 2 protein n=1 Tax=Desulfonatronovibrio hydrogenovorans TaxID=53245 RepID=UPI0005531CD0|nr:glycosyltransferase family 2 protein [Desulfonatronovibrio hydrogenovorans]